MNRPLVMAVTLLTAAGLTSCSSAPETPVVPAVEAATDPPVVQTGQLNRIVTDLASVAEQADANSDVGVLQQRFVGSAFEAREATYQAKSKFADRRPPNPVGETRLVDVVPKAHSWPRSVLTVTQKDDSTAPVMRVLWQENARTPYREAAEASLLPGAEVPSFPNERKGVEWADVASTDGVAISVEDAIGRLSDVLMKGDGSEHKDFFASNQFFDTVGKEQEQESKAATADCEACFAYEVNHKQRPGQVWAVKAADGSVVALSVLDVNRTFTVNKAGAKMPLTGELKALSGKSVAAKKLDISMIETVILTIPTAESGGQVQLIGADRLITSVEAS